MSKTNKIMKAVRSSKGRFFGLYTNNGEAINAQFVSESPMYITVYDRNSHANRKLAKKSLYGIKLSDVRVGAV